MRFSSTRTDSARHSCFFLIFVTPTVPNRNSFGGYRRNLFSKSETAIIDAFSTPRNTIKTLILLAICGLSAIASAVVGIDDNLPGILLAFLAAIAFVLAFAHPWRTARKFMFIILASVLSFVLFVTLNIMFDSVAQDPTTSGALLYLIQSPAINALNLIIIMISPAAFIVGTVGSVTMFIRSRREIT